MKIPTTFLIKGAILCPDGQIVYRPAPDRPTTELFFNKLYKRSGEGQTIPNQLTFDFCCRETKAVDLFKKSISKISIDVEISSVDNGGEKFLGGDFYRNGSSANVRIYSPKYGKKNKYGFNCPAIFPMLQLLEIEEDETPFWIRIIVPIPIQKARKK